MEIKLNLKLNLQLKFTFTYKPNEDMVTCSNSLERTLTRSHAALLLVSTSEPSMSLLIYSSGLSSNNSSSDAIAEI